ncbi:hypothetical protein D918_04430 [Trichuris suis]|nr:hypothetical protein D918_04430 [Trichuris suis]
MLKREVDKRKQVESSISLNVQGSSEGSAESPKDFGNSPNRSADRYVCGHKSGETIGRIQTIKLDERAEHPRYSPNVKNRELEKYGIEFCAKNLSKRKLDSPSPPNCFGIIAIVGEGKWKSICLKTIIFAASATFIGWFVYATYFYVTHKNHACP